MGNNRLNDSQSTPLDAKPDVSIKEMADQQRKIIADTKRYWTERSNREISSGDALEMVANVTGFFDVLCRWSCQGEEKEDAGWKSKNRK